MGCLCFVSFIIFFWMKLKDPFKPLPLNLLALWLQCYGPLQLAWSWSLSWWKNGLGFSGEKSVLCLQPCHAAGTSRPGGNFPFASHTSSLGSCSISEKPGTAGLWGDSCSCVTLSIHPRTPVLPAIAAGGGEKTFKAHARAISPRDAP